MRYANDRPGCSLREERRRNDEPVLLQLLLQPWTVHVGHDDGSDDRTLCAPSGRCRFGHDARRGPTTDESVFPHLEALARPRLTVSALFLRTTRSRQKPCFSDASAPGRYLPLLADSLAQGRPVLFQPFSTVRGNLISGGTGPYSFSPRLLPQNRSTPRKKRFTRGINNSRTHPACHPISWKRLTIKLNRGNNCNMPTVALNWFPNG